MGKEVIGEKKSGNGIRIGQDDIGEFLVREKMNKSNSPQ